MKSNLLLALILIIVGTFAYWFEFQKKPETTRVEEANKKLLAHAMDKEFEKLTLTDKVKGVEVDLICREKCKLNEPGSKWEIITPIQFKADETHVNNFINSLVTSTIDEQINFEGSAEENLVKFGLGKDRRDLMKVTLKLKGEDDTYTFYLGDDSAVGENTYLYLVGPKIKSDRVLMVTKTIKTGAQNKLSFWRTKRLFDFASSEVASFKLINSTGTLELKKESNAWYFSDKEITDSDIVESYVTGIALLSAEDFVSDDKEKGRKDLKLPSRPFASVLIKNTKGDAPFTLDVFEVKSGKDSTSVKLYGVLAHKNYIVELGNIHREKFSKVRETFRFKGLVLPTQKEATRKLSLITEKDKTKLEFASEDGKEWKLLNGKVDGFDSLRVQDAFGKLTTAKVQEFKGPKPLPKGFEEVSKWIFTGKDGKNLNQFSIYSKNDKSEYYVRLSNGSKTEFAKLDKQTAENFPTKAADFQKK